MVDQITRQKVLDSFDKKDFYYYHRTPQYYEDFIDGMAWLGICCGAAYRAGDALVASATENSLRRMLEVGEDARNYIPVKLNDKYKASETMPGYWYRQGQSFAGPAGLYYAIKNGAKLDNPYSGRKIRWKARSFVYTAPFFGVFAWGIPKLRQHLNSVFIAHLILDKKPLCTMKWMTKHNPFFSYIFGDIVDEEYPVMKKTDKGHTVKRKDIVELSKRKPNSWIFRSDPYSEYVREGNENVFEYTPIARLVGEYLQDELKKKDIS